MMYAEDMRRFLSEATGRPVRLRINDNAHNLLSVSPERPGPGLRVSMHRVFLSADDDLKRSLVEFITGPTPASRRAVRIFIASLQGQLAPAPAPIPEDNASHHHDLDARAKRINELCYEGRLEYHIRWSKPPAPRRRTMSKVTLGTWNSARKTINIHPMLDDPKVPGFYIDSVIHHEMAHIAIPSEVGGTGRMHHHTPKFRALERRYPWFEAAMAWEKANLGGLIRAWCSRHRKPKTVRQVVGDMLDLFGT